MLKDTGFMFTVVAGSAIASGASRVAPVEKLGLPNNAGGTLQITPVNGISNLTVSVKTSGGTAYIQGVAGASIGSGASGTYYAQVIPNGAKVTLL